MFIYYLSEGFNSQLAILSDKSNQLNISIILSMKINIGFLFLYIHAFLLMFLESYAKILGIVE